MKKRFLFVLMLGMSFAPTALAGSKLGEQKLSETNMAGVRCGEQFMNKNLADRTVAPRESKSAQAGKAHAAL
ncbi:MAG: hypothetical protein A2X94_12505 [Bdellovibrionales bacterium GWB1_55_8]|nr:MAG: hypothetical protein A2X94_12505 [Bdellovibrionales bacterium GWB1_55_8]